MRYMKFSKEQVEQWYSEYKEGLSQKSIADKYKVAPESIKKYFKIYNIDVDWNSYHIKLSKEDLEKYNKARKLYVDEGYSMKKAREEVGIPLSKFKGFTNYLKRTGIKIKSLSQVASFVEQHAFFSNIDSEIKAYLLGFFAADGHIEKRKDYDSYTLRIGVSIKDVHILMLYNNFITNNRSAISIKDTSANIALTSKQIGEDLLKMGFDSNKTKSWKNLPKLDKKFQRHFVRGFFDGDGSVSLDVRKANNRLGGFNRRATLICYSKNILEQISDISGVEFNYRLHKGGPSKVRGTDTIFSDCWVAEVWNFENLRKLHKYLYEDSNYYFLRKKYKFDLAIKEDKECYASLQGNLH